MGPPLHTLVPLNLRVTELHDSRHVPQHLGLARRPGLVPAGCQLQILLRHRPPSIRVGRPGGQPWLHLRRRLGSAPASVLTAVPLRAVVDTWARLSAVHSPVLSLLTTRLEPLSEALARFALHVGASFRFTRLLRLTGPNQEPLGYRQIRR